MMIVRNNRIALTAFLSLIMGFAMVVLSGCPLANADDDDSATDDDDSAAVDDDDSAE
tara:strand:+ start:1764 stop:1934 length:171 start_codon:yes stop_codon:yes gene_type:complete